VLLTAGFLPPSRPKGRVSQDRDRGALRFTSQDREERACGPQVRFVASFLLLCRLPEFFSELARMDLWISPHLYISRRWLVRLSCRPQDRGWPPISFFFARFPNSFQNLLIWIVGFRYSVHILQTALLSGLASLRTEGRFQFHSSLHASRIHFRTCSYGYLGIMTTYLACSSPRVVLGFLLASKFFAGSWRVLSRGVQQRWQGLQSWKASSSSCRRTSY
jgi:hypothetical protein